MISLTSSNENIFRIQMNYVIDSKYEDISYLIKLIKVDSSFLEVECEKENRKTFKCKIPTDDSPININDKRLGDYVSMEYYFGSCPQKMDIDFSIQKFKLLQVKFDFDYDIITNENGSKEKYKISITKSQENQEDIFLIWITYKK